VIVVVGAGWAGIAAATKLADAGRKVLLVERSREAGGRAGSFWSPEHGEWLDHGTHLFIGAYRTVLGLIAKWGGPADSIDFREGLAVPFLLSGGRKTVLRLGRGRLGAAAGLLSFTAAPLRERILAVRGLNALARSGLTGDADRTVSESLASNGIPSGVCCGLFDALTLAVMNAPAAEASASILGAAIREGLLRGGEATRIGLSQVPFRSLYIEPALGWLAVQGVELRLGQEVKQICLRNGAVEGVVIGESFQPAGQVLCALQPIDLLRLLPEAVRQDSTFAPLGKFEYASIAGIHYTFDRPVMKVPFGHLPGGFTHWLFGRGEPETSGWRKVSAVISHAPGRSEVPVEALEDRVLDDLHDRLPAVRVANVVASKAVRTARATAILGPGNASLRPGPITSIRGLYLAGDWTATGLPATIEGAARSGIAAAKVILSPSGRLESRPPRINIDP